MAKFQAPKGTTSISQGEDIYTPDANGVVEMPASLAREQGFPVVEPKPDPKAKGK